MIFEFHPEAKSELFAGIDYYQDCEEGLGYDFSIEIYSGIRNIISYPLAWPTLEGEVRRYLIHRFPYGILYSIEPDKIFILAITTVRL